MHIPLDLCINFLRQLPALTMSSPLHAAMCCITRITIWSHVCCVAIWLNRNLYKTVQHLIRTNTLTILVTSCRAIICFNSTFLQPPKMEIEKQHQPPFSPSFFGGSFMLKAESFTSGFRLHHTNTLDKPDVCSCINLAPPLFWFCPIRGPMSASDG